MSDDKKDDKKTEQAIETTDDYAIIAASTMTLGFPVPPTIAKNVFHAFGQLFLSVFAVPTEYFQGWAREIRAESAAKEAVIKGTAALALSSLAENKELVQRAALSLGNRVVGEQKNKEEIFNGAIGELRAVSSTEDAQCEIDEDWLDMFARHAERKSNKDMQAYFSRVLAGEIRKPGSFSPATIEVLARLTPDTAKLFQRLCNISGHVYPGDAFVLAEPIGIPSHNGMAPLGFSYTTLLELEDAGLISSQLQAAREMSPWRFATTPFVIAGTPVTLVSDLSEEELTRRLEEQRYRATLGVLIFTRAGQELRSIVHMKPNQQYVEKFIEWAARYKMRPVQPKG